GLVQLGRLTEIVDRRRDRVARYRRQLADVPGLRLVADPAYGTSTFQSCWVLLDDEYPMGRDALLASLMEQGISARRGIMASHLEPAYTGTPHVPLPNTERITRDSLILPLFHAMTDDEQDRVVEALHLAAHHRDRTSV